MKDFKLVQAECCNYNGIGCDGINGHHFPTWFPNGMKPRAPAGQIPSGSSNVIGCPNDLGSMRTEMVGKTLTADGT